MLSALVVENFGLFQEVAVEFGPGFNAITGESGSGKSLLFSAISFALGGRATDYVGLFSDSTRVRLTFLVGEHHAVFNDLADIGIEPDDWLVVQRDLSREGRSTYRVQGQVVPAQTVRQTITGLLNITGQHQSMRLADPDTLLGWVDRIAGLDPLRHEVLERYRHWQTALQSLVRLQEAGRHPDEVARLRIVAEDVAGAAIMANEDQELTQELARLRQSQQLVDEYQGILRLLEQDEHGVLPTLGRLVRALDHLKGLDESLQSAVELIESAMTSTQEAEWALNQWHDKLNLDPDHLEQVERRADLLARLKRKYGPSLEEVVEAGNAASATISELDNLAWESDRQEIATHEALRRYEEAAENLSVARSTAAKSLGGEIASLLEDMEMPGTRLFLNISRAPYGPTGWDKMECEFSANPGNPPRPLSKVASGGELSRIALAMAVVEGDRGSATLVLDELDAGLGGGGAERVGALLAKLGQSRQILVISHQPTVAARAACHVMVSKTVLEQSTESHAMVLTAGAREREIARMLSGNKESLALAHARQLLAREVSGA